MGLIERVLGLVFGGDRNVVRETVEVFRENAETGAERSAKAQRAAMTQYSDEFKQPGRGGFDRFMDGVNRLPRPALALGTLGLFVSAMVAPLWFSERMQGIALVPEPLWWLLGVIVSFYFGARHQVKTQEFQSSIAQTLARAPQVMQNLQDIHDLRKAIEPKMTAAEVAQAATHTDADLTRGVIRPDGNPALEEWYRASRK